VYEGRANISCSFDPRTLLCHVCEGGVHSVLHSEENMMPKLFVLSDQMFPPKLAATNPGMACGAVIRVEDGSPRELVDTFRKITEGKNLQIGSVILISSISHLGRNGTAKYAEDIASAIAALEDDFKGRVRVCHGLPLPGDTIPDKSITRSLLDVMQWFTEIDRRTNYHLPDTNRMFVNKVLAKEDNETISCMAAVGLHHSLPTTMKGGDKTSFYSNGDSNLVAELDGIEPDLEAELLAMLTSELNGNYSLNLDTTPKTRGTGTSEANTWMQDINLVVAGASHAGRLAESLGRHFKNMVDLSMSGWRLTESSALDLAEDIKDQTPDHLAHNTVVILQLFDNAIFKGTDRHGRMVEPFRKDGTYHIHGNMSVASEEEVKFLFTLAAPAIRAAKKCPVILLTPLYRYVTGRCCTDPAHLTNFAETHFTAQVGSALQKVGKCLRSLIWQRHWKSVNVVNPAAHMGIGAANSMSGEEADLRMGEMLQMWGKDPIHPTTAAYDQLAESLIDKVADIMEVTAPAPSGPSTKRRRVESSGPDNRVGWVHTSSTEICRQAGTSGHDRRGGIARDNRPARDGWQNRGRGHSGNAGPRGGHSGNAGPRVGYSGNAGPHKRARRGF